MNKLDILTMMTLKEKHFKTLMLKMGKVNQQNKSVVAMKINMMTLKIIMGAGMHVLEIALPVQKKFYA